MWVTGWLMRSCSRSMTCTRRQRRRRDAPLQGSIRDSLLEDRCLLSAIVMPSSTVSSTGAVLYDGVTGQYVKQITITNNSSSQTI